MKNEVYNMDCIEYMRSLPDNAFDIAVCDPPYGKGNDDSLVAGGGGRKDSDIVSSGITAHWNRFSGGKTMRRYYTPPQSDWNRLRGGRRERYYSPIPGRNMGDEIQSAKRGGKFRKLPLGMLHHRRSFSTSSSVLVRIR